MVKGQFPNPQKAHGAHIFAFIEIAQNGGCVPFGPH